MIRNARFHRWRDAQPLMCATKVILHKISRDRMSVVFHFFEKAFVGRVKRRINTPQEILYYENGGILQYVLRQLAAKG